MTAPRGPLAFYTPLKHPFQPEPSGDREIGRMLLQALAGIGYAPRLASRLLTWQRHFDPAEAVRLERMAAVVIPTLLRRYRRHEPLARPRLWLTYQGYHRAPDLLGPAVTTALEIPYVLVDTALSRKSRRGAFRPWVSAARLAVRRADLVFLMSPRDLPAVAALRGPGFTAERVRLLPPAVDLARFEPTGSGREAHRRALAGRFAASDGPVILAVAAMREAGKLDAYRLLAAALGRLRTEAPGTPWRLAVVGDGPARPRVEAALAALPAGRVAYLGTLEPDALPSAYLGADLFAFPGRFHVAYLQAAAAGLPVVCCSTPEPDVPDMMVAPAGTLPVERTPAALAAALARLLDDPGQRDAMGRAARRFVEAERTLPAFQQRLAEGLALLAGA